MLELVGVSKRFRGREAPILSDVSITVARGEIALISGATGSGKTTLLSLIYGNLEPDQGSIRACGQDIGKLRRSSLPELRRRMVLVPQEVCLLEDRTVEHNVSMPLLLSGVDEKAVERRVTNVIKAVGMDWAQKNIVSGLSSGERRRVSLARAIALEPEVLLLDEPDAHLDAQRRDELCGILDQLRNRGVACVVTSNENQLQEVGAYCGWRAFELVTGKLTERVLGFPEREVTGTELRPQIRSMRAASGRWE